MVEACTLNQGSEIRVAAEPVSISRTQLGRMSFGFPPILGLEICKRVRVGRPPCCGLPSRLTQAWDIRPETQRGQAGWGYWCTAVSQENAVEPSRRCTSIECKTWPKEKSCNRMRQVCHPESAISNAQQLHPVHGLRDIFDNVVEVDMVRCL